MYYDEQINKIIDYYDEKDDFRVLCAQAFSDMLSRGKSIKQPGAIKIGKIPDDKRITLLKIIQPHWWDLNKSRQNKYKAQVNTKNIALRVPEKLNTESESKVWSRRSINSPITQKYYRELIPYFNFLETFCKMLGTGELGNVTITSLNSHSDVKTHYDPGCYYMLRDRYHVVLSSEGSRQVFEEDEYLFEEGDIWWFNTRVKHSAYNDSDNPRIHLLIDILPQKNVRIQESLNERMYDHDPIFINKGV